MKMPGKHAEAGQSIFMSSVTGLANTLAVIVTFLCAPLLYGRTVGWIQGFVTNNYGYGWSDITAVLWALVTACLVFFISRASISTALVFGGLALATRLF